MSDDKQGASVSEGQASPPAGDEHTPRRWRLYDQSSDYKAAWSVSGDTNPPAIGFAEVVEVMPVAEHRAVVAVLSHTGGAVDPEQADVAVLPEAVSGSKQLPSSSKDLEVSGPEAVSLSGLEQTVEAMARARFEREREIDGISYSRWDDLVEADRVYFRNAVSPDLAAALSTGQIVRASERDTEAQMANALSADVTAFGERAEKAEAEVERLRATAKNLADRVEYGLDLSDAYTLANSLPGDTVVARRPASVFSEIVEALAALRAALSEGERHG